MNGILIIDKPEEYTSFDVVAVLRRLLHVRRIGHTGTLDPMATGVLPVLIGPACRANELLPIQDKEYIAGFSLGKKSDTEDIWGTVETVSDAPVSAAALETAAAEFRGEISQVPPMVSSVKKDGKRLYELARQGLMVERSARPVTVYRLEILEYLPSERSGVLSVHCSKGTYVRSLIHEIGERLGVGGVLTSLRRTMASGFALSQAITLDEARKRAAEDTLNDSILPVEAGFETLSAVTVSENQACRFSNGGALFLDRVPCGEVRRDVSQRVRVHAPSGLFLGLGEIRPDQNELAIVRLLGGGIES